MIDPKKPTAHLAALELALEPPSPELGAELRAGLERSGMTFGECSLCGRPYGSRITTTLCPPCRGATKNVSCWFCKSDSHNSPDCTRRPGLA